MGRAPLRRLCSTQLEENHMHKTRTLLLSAVLATAGTWAYAAGDTAQGASAGAGASGTTSFGHDQAGARGSIQAQGGAGAGVGGDAARIVGGTASAVGGGVGINARDMLSSQAPDHNVRMVFSLNTGNYVADVDVRVRDARGNTVLQGTSDGPWLLAKLQPGNYTVDATYGGRTVTQRINVGRTGVRSANFRWPASVEQQLTAQGGAQMEHGQILGTGPQEPHRR
jgi:hypothetical protein